MTILTRLSAISEISSREVAGPSYDIRETAGTDVVEFDNIREKNRHPIVGMQKCCDTVLELEREIQKKRLYWKYDIM